ncbi:hypothetical protein CGSHiII_00015 [Haemophilus influenzae PittII]|nr:hypothetical protein CGSHiII_00015 [Haemophilus influenzae PittII]
MRAVAQRIKQEREKQTNPRAHGAPK